MLLLLVLGNFDQFLDHMVEENIARCIQDWI